MRSALIYPYYYSGSGGALTPDQVSGLMFWFDVSQETGLNDGDLVAVVHDRSGNGRDITQSSDARKPTYKTNIINGRPVLRMLDAVRFFNVADKSHTDWMHKGDSTLFFVIKSGNDTTTHCLFDSNSATASNVGRLLQFQLTGAFRDLITAGGGVNVINNLTANNSVPLNTWIILVIRFEQAKTSQQSTIEANNILSGVVTQEGVVSNLTASIAPTWFIRSATKIGGFIGDIAEWFGYSRALTDDEIRLLVGGVNYSI